MRRWTTIWAARRKRHCGNHRNGYGNKTVLTDTGKLGARGSARSARAFRPGADWQIPAALSGFDDKIISMYARGLSAREIAGAPGELYGIEVSPQLISTVTDAVLEEVGRWQSRGLDALYALVFFDAIRVKMRDEGMVATRRCIWRSGFPARAQGSARDLDRADRGGEVLDARHERAEATAACRTS